MSPEARAEGPHSEPGLDRPIRILYMEDDEGLARLFQKRLARAGYEVDLAQDGEEGLERYAEGQYDILAIDYMMPGFNGLQVIQHLSERGQIPPTIMLTANGDEGVAVDALKLGASEYIVKDTAGGYIRLLPSVIQRLLEKHFLKERERKALAALQESEERLRAITESASDPIVSFDGRDRILLWNRSAAAVFGYTPEQARGMTMIQLFQERFHAAYRQQLQRLRGGEESGPSVDMAAMTKSGHEVPVEVSFSSWKTGKELCFTCILRDTTDRKRTENALQEAARLDATATLAGGVAHQFNNLLFGVLGNTELLQMRLEDRPDAIGRLQMISQQAQRASELVQQMLAFARRGQYQPVVMSLNSTIRETIQLQELDLKAGITVQRQTDAELWKISADPTQMSQVVMNLFSNAVEALEGSGQITIRTANVKLDAGHGERNETLKPGPYVCLTVHDSGIGMSAETLSQIYTPFFTTKFQGRGLGMAAVWGIVKHHGGDIEIDSQAGGGTEIRVYLPAIDSEVRLSRSQERAPAPRGTETLLVVDEEEVFISVSREFLEILGYRVLTASSGAAALELAREYPGKISLALLDTNMSVLGSRETYTSLIEAQPELRVILCSSYEKDQTAEELLTAGASTFLRKPFGLDVLGLEIRRALDDG